MAATCWYTPSTEAARPLKSRNGKGNWRGMTEALHGCEASLACQLTLCTTLGGRIGLTTIHSRVTGCCDFIVQVSINSNFHLVFSLFTPTSTSLPPPDRPPFSSYSSSLFFIFLFQVSNPCNFHPPPAMDLLFPVPSAPAVSGDDSHNSSGPSDWDYTTDANQNGGAAYCVIA